MTSRRAFLLLLMVVATSPAAASAAPVWGPVTRVGEEEPTEAGRPALAAAGQHFGLAWLSSGRSAVRIAVGTHETGIGLGRSVSEGGPVASDPRLLLNPGGEVFAVWMEESAPLRIVVAAGSVEEGPFTKTTLADGRIPSMRAAANRIGHVAVAWTQQAGGEASWEVLLALREPGGTFGPPIRIGTASGYGAEVAVAVSDRGEVVVLWVDTPQSGSRTLFARLRRPSGELAPVETVQHIDPTLNSPVIGGLQAAWTVDGKRVAAWEASPVSCMYCLSRVVHMASATADEPFSPPRVISDEQSNHLVQLLTRPLGGFAIAWDRGDADRMGSGVPNDVQVLTADNDGRLRGPFGHGAPDDGDRAHEPKLALAGKNEILLAWRDFVPQPGWDAIFASYRPNGAAITRPVTPQPRRPLEHFDIAGDGHGHLFAAWTENHGGARSLWFRSSHDDSKPPRVRILALRQKIAPPMVKFRVSERSTITLEVRRRHAKRAALTRRFRRSGGTGTYAMRGLKRLREGRYTLRLISTDVAGNVGRSNLILLRR